MAARFDRDRQSRQGAYVRVVCLAALCLISALVVGLVVYCSVARVSYPFELSKMEGYFVDHARLVAVGKPLYAPPSAEFIPLLYTPLSHYAASWLMSAGLDGFCAARLVSLLGLVGAIGVGMWLVVRATAYRWLCLLVPVLVASKYFDVDCFYDQARPDNLMSLFCMTALAALTLRSQVVSVLLFTVSGVLAVFTKQSSVIVLVGTLVGMCFVQVRFAMLCAIALLAALGVTFFAFNAVTHGWLYVYTIVIPGHHGLTYSALLNASAEGFMGGFALHTAATIVLTALVLVGRKAAESVPDLRYRTRALVAAGGLASMAFAAASMWQAGAVRNVFIVFAVMSATVIPVAVGCVLERFTAREQRQVAWSVAMLLLCLVIGRGLQDPRKYVPTAQAAQIWSQFRQTLAQYGPPEQAWVMFHGSVWGDRQPAPGHVHLAALSDYVGGHFGTLTGRAVPPDLLARIKAQQFKVIVAPDWESRVKRLIAEYYEPDRTAAEVRLPAFSGFEPAVELYWIPRKSTAGPTSNGGS